MTHVSQGDTVSGAGNFAKEVAMANNQDSLIKHYWEKADKPALIIVGGFFGAGFLFSSWIMAFLVGIPVYVIVIYFEGGERGLDLEVYRWLYFLMGLVWIGLLLIELF